MTPASRRGRGEGSIYQRASDDRWVGVVDLGWHAGKRNRRQVTAKTKRELQPKFARLKRDMEAGLQRDGAMSVERWLTYWLAEIAPATAKSPTTLRGYRGVVTTWLIPHLGKHRLDALSPEHVRALYRTMTDAGRSPATMRQAHAVLSRALKIALEEGKIIRNPAATVRPPTGDKGSHGKLTLDEARAILLALRDRPDKARWIAALLLGIRQGEALGLAWEDVDLEHGRIHIRHAQKRGLTGGYVLGEPKSASSRRSIPLLPALVPPFADLKATATGPLVWGPRDNKADWKDWQTLLASAGVEPKPLHAARATTASLLSEFNVPPKIIAEILGHADVRVTEGHYIHGDERLHREALAPLARLLLDP